MILRLPGENLLCKRLLSLLVGQSRTEVLSRSLNNSPHLREWRRLEAAVVLFVVSLGVQRGAHLQKLQVALKFRGEVRGRHVEPFGAGGGGLFLWEVLVDFD